MSDGLRIRDLHVSFGAARVLRGVDLDVAPGEVVGYVGPNGAGKTTTLRTVSGLVTPVAGEIEVDGKSLAGGRPDRTARLGIAHVPEGRGLLPNMTVSQNLRLGAVGVGGEFGSSELADAFATFPKLESLRNSKCALLSGGEQQMVALARGLITAPRILMVDELSLGLAPKIIQDILVTLQSRARTRDLGLLLVDQNVRALSRVCDRIVLLQHGTAVALRSGGDVEELAREVYFGERITID